MAKSPKLRHRAHWPAQTPTRSKLLPHWSIYINLMHGSWSFGILVVHLPHSEGQQVHPVNQRRMLEESKKAWTGVKPHPQVPPSLTYFGVVAMSWQLWRRKKKIFKYGAGPRNDAAWPWLDSREPLWPSWCFAVLKRSLIAALWIDSAHDPPFGGQGVRLEAFWPWLQ